MRRLADIRLATVVLVVDDLHWADDGSLDFARHLLAHNRDMPLLAVFLTRPALFDREPGWAAGDIAHRRIDIRPLDTDDSRELAEGLLQRIADVPDALRTIVTGGSDGNPFYMEELVKMLVDDGVIVVDGEGWRVLPERLLGGQGAVGRWQECCRRAWTRCQGGSDSHCSRRLSSDTCSGIEALAAVDAAPAAVPALLRRQLVLPRDHRTGEAVSTFSSTS